MLCLAALAGCASSPTRYASGGAGGGRGGFDSQLGVFASPRLYADGEPIPRGGGQYLVGRPYTIGGRLYYPNQNPAGYTVVGTASWYGDAFHGRRTANGEVFDKNSISAAHPTLPLPSYVRVTNLGNGRSLIVRVNDRGPYHGGRVMDVSQRVADALDFRRAGTARIRVEYVGKASLGGSDDEKLLATLRVDGTPAGLDGSDRPVMVAGDDPPAPLPGLPQFSAPVIRPPDPEAQPEAPPPAAEPTPRHRRFATPIPPQRPFDMGSSEPPADAERRPASRAPVPPAISFAAPGPSPVSFNTPVPPRRPLPAPIVDPGE